MKTKTYKLKTKQDVVNFIGWLYEYNAKDFVKKTVEFYKGAKGWYPIYLHPRKYLDIVSTTYYISKGTYGIELKKDCWLGKAGEVVRILI